MSEAPLRRRRRKEARPGELAAAALAEFAEKGFAAARLEDIAARAGVAKGTVYLYFDSKDALFEEVLRQNVLPTIADVETRIADFPGSSRDMLGMMLRVVYAQMRQPGMQAILRIVLTEGPRQPGLMAFYHREVVSKGMALMRRILARGIERGEFRAGPQAGQPLAVIGPVIAAAVWEMLFGAVAPLDLEAHVEAHVDLVMAGLAARA